MSKIDKLISEFERNVNLPWRKRAAGMQKVWFVVFDPSYEREVRARMDEFKLVTRRADHTWVQCDLTDAFPEWMAAHEYREGHFDDPDDLEFIMPDFLEYLEERVRARLADAEENSLFVLTGVGTLFGFVYVSGLVDAIASAIPGRLAVFFPGRHEKNRYRLLDARDGWDYHALPIKV